MGKIQQLLKEAKTHLAVALLRTCRDVWPEGEVFGPPEVGPEHELLLLREIFHTDLPSKWTHPFFLSLSFFLVLFLFFF